MVQQASFLSPVPTIDSKEAEYLQTPPLWLETMRAFEAEDAAAVPPSSPIVFTGSSSITQWTTLRRDMAPLTVINRGFGGSTMRDALYWLETIVLKHVPRAVVLYEGDNDIAHFGRPPDDVVAGFTTFVDRVHARLPSTRIYSVSLKPSVLRWSEWPKMQTTNAALRAICATRPNLEYIDIVPPMLTASGTPRTDIFEADGLHMNALGYEAWTSVIQPFLLAREARFE